MLKRNKTMLAVLLALFLAFAAGIAHLFELRFQIGDIYPPYSSLRTDPLGGKALYDSFGALPGVSVSRHFREIRQLHGDPSLTLFYTGVPVHAAWESTELDDFDKLFAEGARVVLTFSPVTEKQTEKETAKKPDKRERETEETQIKILDAREFATRWGFKFRQPKSAAKSVAHLQAQLREGATEPTVAWRSLTYFDQLGPGWRVLYTCENHPVLIEKNVGAGSLVLSADSYFLSNEALRRDRAPALLGWLTGGKTRLVFDELHHGVQEKPGLATIARHYRLQWFLGALAVLAGLFIWKNATSLVPVRAAHEEIADVQTGQDSFAGFVNLLRRHLAPQDLLRVCWQEWRQSFAQRHRITAAQVARAESIVAGTPAKQALTGFRALHELFAPTKK